MGLIEEKNRMIQLMGIKPETKKINEHQTIVVSKLGADGNVYAIIKESQKFYIKKAKNSSDLMLENFNYLGGVENMHKEALPTYERALIHLDLKLQNVNESAGVKAKVDVYKSDYLIKEEKEKLASQQQKLNEHNADFNKMFHKTRLKVENGKFVKLKESFNPYSYSGAQNITDEEEPSLDIDGGISPEVELGDVQSEIEGSTENQIGAEVTKDITLPNGEQAVAEISIDVEIEPKAEHEEEIEGETSVGFGGFAEGTKVTKKQIVEFLQKQGGKKLVKESGFGEEAFRVDGYYTVSNSGGYEIMIADSGDAAKVKDAYGSNNPQISDWLEIEYVDGEDGEPEPVIDPNGYNIPLNMVMRANRGVRESKKLVKEFVEQTPEQAAYNNLIITTENDGDLYREVFSPVIETAIENGKNAIGLWFEPAKVAIRKFIKQNPEYKIADFGENFFTKFVEELSNGYQEEINQGLGVNEGDLNEDLNTSGFPVGTLVFVREAGNTGLVGLVTSGLDENGEQEVYLRGYNGETWPFAPNELVDIITSPELMGNAENKGDLTHYQTIAKKLGVELDPKYLSYDSENELEENTTCASVGGQYDVPLFGKPLTRKTTLGESNDDEYKPMRSITVKFDDGNEIKTNINGTKSEIQKYYVGKTFNIGNGEKDKMAKATEVVFNDESVNESKIYSIVDSVITESLKKKL